jgi:roadblock/LC7 domain-containing protein
MQWSDAINAISSAAPLIGSLFGPAGTAVGALASTGLRIAATALGVAPTQDAVAQAVATDPQAALKLAQYQMDNKLELQKLQVSVEIAAIAADTATIQAVNSTMQVEAKAEKWWTSSWRPFWGFASGTAFIAVCILVSIIAWNAVINKDSAALGNIPMIIGAFSTLFAIPGAILGIASWKRGEMQIEQAKREDYPEKK